MAEFGPQIAEDVVAACTAGAAEVGEAFSRTLDQPLTVAVGSSATYNAAEPPKGFDGAALLIVFTVDGAGAVAVLPESSGLLPAWVASPDPTGQSKLATLAQELGMLLLPETVMASDFQAVHVANAKEALTAGKPADDAALVSLTLASESNGSGTLTMLWPVADPKAVLSGGFPEEGSQPQAKPALESTSLPRVDPPQSKPSSEKVKTLPSYARSLLRIKLPVTVTLASKKQPVEQITSLNPGSIIQFDKSCEEMLELGVGEQIIGRGEAVKVGDKFGLRITSLVLPDERFHPLRASDR